MADKSKTKAVKLTSPPFVFYFPSLFEKTSYKEGKPSFNTKAIFNPPAYKGKELERWKALMTEIDRQCVETFGKPWAECRKPFDPDDPDAGGIKDFKAGLYPATVKNKAGVAQPGFEKGKVFGTIKTYSDFGAVKFNGVGVPSTEISIEEDNTDEIYSGAVGRAKLSVWVYNGDGTAGVSLWISSVQKLGNGPKLGGRTDAKEDYDNEEVDGSWIDQEEPAADDPFN